MTDIHSLPDDVDLLKEIISKQILENQTQKSQLKVKNSQLQTQATKLKFYECENLVLREQLRLERMRQYASTSEAYPYLQSTLFDEPEVVLKKESEETVKVSSHQKKRPKRKPLPEELPREDVVIELPESERLCAKDGTELKVIGEEVSEQLDIIPQQMKVIRTIRKKYACPCCQASVKIAPLPNKIIPKGIAAPGLLAHIAVCKYVDGLPLYRQEQILKRSKIEFPRNTMASSMIQVSEKLIPLYNIMQEDLLSSDYVCCDETKVQVLKESGKKATSQSYMWIRARHGPGVRPIVLFDYDPSRSKNCANELLQGFEGYLQVDGYAGYDEVCRTNGVTRVGCLVHVRRKFAEVIKISKIKDGPAHDVINTIKEIYKIEEKIKDVSITHRQKVRLEKTKPMLENLGDWLKNNLDRYPPQSLLGKAIQYGHNQWPYIMNALKDGRLALDNNFTENRIRPFAIGRKNWLFSNSVAGARASGMLYSILQSAKSNGFNPFAYMKYLLTRLPLCKSVEEIERLVPHKINPNLII